MHEFEISDELRKQIKKLKNRDSVYKKIIQIVNNPNPNHYKNLRKPLQDFKRVHVDKSFVLLFKYKNDKIHFNCIKHHDKAYK